VFNSMSLPSASVNSMVSANDSSLSLNEIKLLGQSDERTALKQATQQFEALFVQMMLKSMRSTVGENGFMSSSATNTFQEMQDNELAKQISGNGGFGLTEQIIDSVLQQAGVKADAKSSANVESPLDTMRHLQGRIMGQTL